MNTIDSFLEQYQKEYDYFYELSKIVSNKCESDLSKRGVKSIVTYRSKKIESLKSKIDKRNNKIKYKSVAEIYKDIKDLAGVRISLYFPGDRKEVDIMINELFSVVSKKDFPEEDHTPTYKKRFSGYWASHYRIKLLKTNIDQSQARYATTIVEIQVASLLMHSWAEVEHDLVYKPINGKLSDEEYAILDEINGLVLSGEIALERLQKAMLNRLSKNNENFNDNYELQTYLTKILNKDINNKLSLGYTDLLQNFLKYNKNDNSNFINKYIDNIDKNSNQSITDQLLDIIISDKNYYNKFSNFILNHIKKEKQYSNLNNNNEFEKFIRTWIFYEKSLNELIKNKNLPMHNKYILSINQLKSLKIYNHDEIERIIYIRKIRNEIVHGIEIPESNLLIHLSQDLLPIIRKTINLINNKKAKEKLEKEFNKYNDF